MPSHATARSRRSDPPPCTTAPPRLSETAYDTFHAPPVATVQRNRNNQSPTSTIGVTSAAAAPLTPPRPRRSQRSQRPQRNVTRACYDESPATLDGASLPPESPYQSPYKCPPAVGIPDPKPARAIKNTDEDKFNEGYDSDGEIGPFFDAVEDEINADVEVDDVDDGLPTSMGSSRRAIL